MIPDEMSHIDDYEIKKFKDVESLLLFNNRDFYSFNYQHKNNAFVYEIDDEMVALLPSDLKSDGIVFYKKEVFLHCIESDKFPIENPEKNIFELNQSLLKNFKIGPFLAEVSQTPGLPPLPDTLDREWIKNLARNEKFRAKVTGIKFLSFVMLYGEVLRSELGAKWVLRKQYGLYNPYFEPYLLNSSNKIIDIVAQSVRMFEIKIETNWDWYFDSPFLINPSKSLEKWNEQGVEYIIMD